ncbi:MAG: PQQ-binding-like beta-propeller repeat protein [Planctomycetales bacterium]|nr:PQQ-binding-like beta-propeller repeat protein [Planctomycetales bacterium]
MNTDRLLKELAKREVVSDAVLKKLADKLADKTDQPSPRAVAKFLVDQGHLTVSQAKRALRAILTPEESAILDAAPLSAADDLPDLPSLSQVHGSAGGGASQSSVWVADLGSESGESAKPSKGKKPKKKKKGQTGWDSPLMLLGGGGLILMLLVGAVILVVMQWESADQKFTGAQEAYDQGSYPQAIADFEDFLKKHPSHNQASLARVRLGTARIRQNTEVMQDYERALAVAVEEADVIEDEDAFREGQGELSALLPTIAKKLSEQADQATEVDQMQKYVDLTTKALELCGNTKLIPGKLRDEGQLNAIRDTLQRIGMRQQALEALQSTLEEMTAASGDGNPAGAYAAQTEFVKAHPELSEDQRLKDAIAAAVAAEKSLVAFVEEPRAAQTEEPESPVVAELAVARPRVKGAAPAAGVAVFRLAGGLYGVSAEDGRLLWRRAVGGAQASLAPSHIDGDWLTFDAKRRELVRLKSETGDLVWRVTLDDEVAQPVIARDKILCAGQTGKLYVVEAASGNLLGHVDFAQPLQSPPAYSEQANAIYLAGEHSSFYTLSADDFSCLGVTYLGHSKGSITAPPVVVVGRVVVFENSGAHTSLLHVLGASSGPVADTVLNSRRINGLVKQPPEVFARRFALVTDAGQVDVFEVSAEDDSQPVVLIASRQPTRPERGAHYAEVVDAEIWLADTGLAKYSIAPAGNRLPVREIEQKFSRDTFLHPLIRVDGVLVHARKRRGKPGVSIAASDVKTGKVYWETDLAAPPAGAPVSLKDAQGILHATAAGSVYVARRPDQRYTALNTPIAAAEAQEPVVFEAAAAAPGGAVYWSMEQGRAAAIVGADASPTFALPGKVACEPTALGEGWVVPLAIGQVHYLAKDGSLLAAPYQPVLRPGSQIAWLPAGAAGDEVVLAGGDKVFALQVVKEDPAQLELAAEIEATGDDQVVGRAAIVEGQAFLPRRDGRLTIHSAASLEETASLDLGGTALWGPFPAPGGVVLATSAGELLFVGPQSTDQPVWRKPIRASDLIGEPLIQSDSITVAFGSGNVARFGLSSGEDIATTDVGQRLATGPTSFGQGMLLATPDGAVVVVRGM